MSATLYDAAATVYDAAKKQQWDKLMVRRLLEVVWHLQRIQCEPYSSEKLAADPEPAWNRSCQAQPSPNSVPIPARLTQWSNHCVACRDCCVRAVRTSASETGAFPCQPVQSSEISPLPLARKPILHPIRRFRGWCGGTCGGRYARLRRVPQVPQPPPVLKTKMKTGLPPWTARRLLHGYRLRGVGLTLLATPTSPPPLQCTGMG
jgi:hypothetical protein